MSDTDTGAYHRARSLLSTAIGILGVAIGTVGMSLLYIAIRLSEDSREPETVDPELAPLNRGGRRE